MGMRPYARAFDCYKRVLGIKYDLPNDLNGENLFKYLTPYSDALNGIKLIHMWCRLLGQNYIY